MRVVFGVQFAAPRQVSRTNTWRIALLDRTAGFRLAAVPEAVAAVCVSATNATNRPDALIDGTTAASPESFPVSSFDTSCVLGVQDPPAPLHVSRT
jgi:hypothetical protein